MAGRYRGPKGTTPTDDEFILERARLVTAVGDYMALLAAIPTPPTEYIQQLVKFQRAIEVCTHDELGVYRDKFSQLVNA
jgi:hypothetical protein